MVVPCRHAEHVSISSRVLRYASAHALLLVVVAIVLLNTWPDLWDEPLVLVVLVPLMVMATAYPSLRHQLPPERSVREGQQEGRSIRAAASKGAHSADLEPAEAPGLFDSPARQALMAATVTAAVVIVLALISVVQPALDRG